MATPTGGKKRKFDNTSSSSQHRSIETDSNVVSKSVDSNERIPSVISSWDTAALNALRISAKCKADITPTQLLDTIFGLRIHNNSRIKRISNMINDKCNAFQLDDTFENIDLQTTNYLLDLLSVPFTSSGIWNLTEIENDRSGYEWFEKFRIKGQNFAHCLNRMIRRRNRNESISEHHFQFLFHAFTSMFGLHGSMAPCIDMQSQQVLNKTVTGSPDLEYSWISKDQPEAEERIICICKVEKGFHCEANSTQLETCTAGQPSTSECPDSTVMANSSTASSHISDKLLGQHGGELLLYYDKSLCVDKVLGLIIQKTKITFTALCMSNFHYDAIHEGTLTDEWAELVFTQPYDFIKREERKFLIEPFVRLGMLQDMKKLYT